MRHARVARFYGFHALGLTDEELFVYEACLPAVWADEVLTSPDAADLTPDGVFDLTLLATGNRDVADDAWTEAAQRKMRAASGGDSDITYA